MERRSRPDFRPQRTPAVAADRAVDSEVAHVPNRQQPPAAGGRVHVQDISALCAKLAAGQKGLVTRAQLVAAGVAPKTITRSAKAGRLHRLQRGVYAVGHLALAPLATEQAALLACGPRAILSRRSAAYAWGLTDHRSPEVEVTVIGNQCRPKPGIHLRRVITMDKRDLRRRHGLPVTSPARTLIDLAAEVSTAELERLVAEARVKRLLNPGELEGAVKRAGTRPGTRRIRALVRSEAKPGITRSAAERILRRLLREARLPQPQTNVRVRTAGVSYEVDFLWPEQKVAIEVDSWQFHGHRRAFETDRRKTMALDAAGYHVIRITATQLQLEPFVVIAQVARALDRAARVRG